MAKLGQAGSEAVYGELYEKQGEDLPSMRVPGELQVKVSEGVRRDFRRVFQKQAKLSFRKSGKNFELIRFGDELHADGVVIVHPGNPEKRRHLNRCSAQNLETCVGQKRDGGIETSVDFMIPGDGEFSPSRR